MADVSSRLKDWSTNEASNSPAGTTTIAAGLDDNLRQIQATTRADLASKGSDIASAATADLGAVAGSVHDITGTATITSFGTVSAGIAKTLQFNSTLVLKYNASNLIVPGAADITVQPTDCLYAISLGSGNWRVPFFQRADGTPLSGGEPAGVVKAYAGTSAPTGYLLCDGTAVSRTTYATLFAVTSTTYGVGDNVSTFNVPDLRGRAVFGKDNMGGTTAGRVTNAISGITGTTLGSAGGSESLTGHTHTGTVDSDGSHTHTDSGHQHVETNITVAGIGSNKGYGTTTITNGNDPGTSAGTRTASATAVISSDGAHTHTFTSASTGAGSSQNMPPAIVLNYIIKY